MYFRKLYEFWRRKKWAKEYYGINIVKPYVSTLSLKYSYWPTLPIIWSVASNSSKRFWSELRWNRWQCRTNHNRFEQIFQRKDHSKALCPKGSLEICQKIYTTGFSDQKFYTLKVQLFLLKKKQCKCINFSYFNSFFVTI